MQETTQVSETNHRYIHSFLLHMGVVRWSKSSRRLELALQYIIDNNIIPEYPMKCLYVDMAKQQKSTYSAVERSLRYGIESMWECDAPSCSTIFFHSSEPVRRPCVSEFLCLFAQAYRQGDIIRWVDAIEV